MAGNRQLDWFCLDLGDGILAEPKLAEFTLALANSAPQQQQRAIFVRHQFGDLHCAVTAYFSPQTAAIAQQLGALNCTAPDPQGLSLVAGDMAAWQLLSGDNR